MSRTQFAPVVLLAKKRAPKRYAATAMTSGLKKAGQRSKAVNGVPAARAIPSSPTAVVTAAVAYLMRTIVMAEDHAIVRQTLRHLLEQEADFHLAGESGNGLEAAGLAAKLQPDVLITDLAMPGLHGLELIKRVRRESPQTRIVVVSINWDEPYVAAAFENGAAGYVQKVRSSQDLVPAIRAVLAGKQYLSPPLNDRMLKRAQADAGSGTLDIHETLTRSETMLLELCAEGCHEHEIATRLDMQSEAVRQTIKSLMRKLRLATHEELVVYAHKRKSG